MPYAHVRLRRGSLYRCICLCLAHGPSMTRITLRRTSSQISVLRWEEWSLCLPTLSLWRMNFPWKMCFWIGNKRMTDQLDILVKRARLRDMPESLIDIGIADGRVVSIEENLESKAEMVINAEGNLVTESFINPHLHLCKVYTLQMMDEEALTAYQAEGMGKAMNAIELAARVKEKYDEAWIIKNVRKAVAQAAIYGNTHIRAFADVDNKARLEGVKALIRAREEFKGIVEIQVCAFAQDGWVREPGADKLMRQALELDADVVGGIPWIEYTDNDVQQHVK